ncbi:uncharacterized protein LOC144159705 isoform X3 [Haemaphysalis longicornis]
MYPAPQWFVVPRPQRVASRVSRAACADVEEPAEEEERSLLADKIEPPSFSPLARTGPPEPLHQNKKLRWDHKVNLIGEKLINPMIHCCDKCSLPILTYGRMIPCKHVFCYDCARKADKTCYRCNDKVQRLEQSNLGTVFMCTFGGSRQGKDSCRRTYLSQRDLQAHISHRHLKGSSSSSSAAAPAVAAPQSSAAVSHGSGPQQMALVAGHHLVVRDPRQHPPPVAQHPPPPPPAPPLDRTALQQPQPQPVAKAEYRGELPLVAPSQPRPYQGPQNPAVSRPNLITVQIQDDSHKRASTMPPPQMPPQYAPHMGQPPPQQSYPPPPQAPPPQAPPLAYNPPYSQGLPATYNASAPPPPPPPPTPRPMFVHQPPPQFAHPPPPPQPPPRFAAAMPPYEEQGGHPPPFHWSGTASMPPPPRATVMPPPPRPMAPPTTGPPATLMQQQQQQQQRPCTEFPPYYGQ